MAPDEEPVTKTLDLLPLYLLRVYETILAMELLLAPPLCVRVAFEETSQQVPEYGDSG